MGIFKNILIVDDNPGDQQLICHLFKKSQFSFSPVYASSIQEAREKLRTQHFHLITLDGVVSGHSDSDYGHLLIPDIQTTQPSHCVVMMICGEKSVVDTGKFLGAHFGFTKDILTRDVRFTTKLFNRQRIFSEDLVLESMSVRQP